MLRSLSCCRYPTTVLMVDDNPRFLMHLSARLNSALHFKLLSDPRDALPLATQEGLFQQIVSDALVIDEGLEIDRKDLSIVQSFQGVRLKNLLDLLESENRFNEISVMVVDYAMPGMNGLDLCRAFANHPAKKILLTGEADHRIAVEAFNQGLIHRFILKQTQEDVLYKELNAAILEMQNIYFSTASRKILMNLGLDEQFKNENFLSLLNLICEKKKYIELYLLNARGALLLLNDQAETEVFICESKKTLESYAQMARDNDAPLWVVEALQKHTHIPYLLGASNEDLPFDQWENFMLSATPIEDSDLFYAFVPADFGIPYDLQHKKIKNYALFIEEHLKQELDV